MSLVARATSLSETSLSDIPPLDRRWVRSGNVTSGECQLEDDCLTSSNYPENYGDDQACEIEYY